MQSLKQSPIGICILMIGLTTPLSSGAGMLDDPEQYRSSLEPYRSLFSFRQITLRSLGPRTDAFNDRQINQFVPVFGDFILAVVFDRLSGYGGNGNLREVYVEDIKTLKRDGEGYASLKVGLKMVRADVEESVTIEIRFVEGAKWKIYNIKIDQLNLVETYRSQFASFLVDNSPAELIAHVQNKTRSLYKDGS